jgi:exodeoxyribonuclease VII small subunit
MATKEISYTEAFERLQAIQGQIESNRLDVDALGAALKEAAGLLQICKDRLLKVNDETQKILEDLQ